MSDPSQGRIGIAWQSTMGPLYDPKCQKTRISCGGRLPTQQSGRNLRVVMEDLW